MCARQDVIAKKTVQKELKFLFICKNQFRVRPTRRRSVELLAEGIKYSLKGRTFELANIVIRTLDFVADVQAVTSLSASSIVIPINR